MTNLDLKNLNSKQERVLCEAYRFIRQRSAWFRAQKETNSENDDVEINPQTTKKAE